MVPEAVIQLIGPSRLDVSMGEEAANRGVSKLARGFREPEGSYSSLEGRRPRKAFLQGGSELFCRSKERRASHYHVRKENAECTVLGGGALVSRSGSLLHRQQTPRKAHSVARRC